MDEKVLKWLYDIDSFINEIESYFDGQAHDFISYKKNLLLKRGVERNLEIIGEAVRRVLDKEPEFPITNAIRIVGLRNQIIHSYDNISDENIWAILTKHLPLLKSEIKRLIKDADMD
ncbi:MAG: DUF86 domain-containing protein [Imperialibacter sp.]|uniref:HepT-like ribonuclease domain-containing protein n=1 Tax=Imperialibacter sp. TaxID=2038411 RepID=UPI0032ECFF58